MSSGYVYSSAFLSDEEALLRLGGGDEFGSGQRPAAAVGRGQPEACVLALDPAPDRKCGASDVAGPLAEESRVELMWRKPRLTNNGRRWNRCSLSPQIRALAAALGKRSVGVGASVGLAARCADPAGPHQCSVTAPQHFLNFLPDPQGQGSFRPAFGRRRTMEAGAGAPRSSASPLAQAFSASTI